MYAYQKGLLDSKMDNYVIIEVGGIGYKVYMTGKDIEDLGNIGEIVKVFIYYKIGKEERTLYGFNTNEELHMFELLLSVNGVGAKAALSIVNTFEPLEFALAIISNDLQKINSIKGIGKKSAQRIILELHDRIKKENSNLENIDDVNFKKSFINSKNIDETISALTVLGYNRKEINAVIEMIEDKNSNVEDLIKKCLILLSR